MENDIPFNPLYNRNNMYFWPQNINPLMTNDAIARNYYLAYLMRNNYMSNLGAINNII